MTRTSADIGSRVPQIVHNHKTRCAGLSLAMFFFSITGNVTYVASILFKSTERRYLLTNLSWLWYEQLSFSQPVACHTLTPCPSFIFAAAQALRSSWTSLSFFNLFIFRASPNRSCSHPTRRTKSRTLA